MDDLEFIKKFSKITVTKACKDENVCRPPLLQGKGSDEKRKKVRKRLEHELASLYLLESENDGKEK